MSNQGQGRGEREENERERERETKGRRERESARNHQHQHQHPTSNTEPSHDKLTAIAQNGFTEENDTRTGNKPPASSPRMENSSVPELLVESTTGMRQSSDLDDWFSWYSPSTLSTRGAPPDALFTSM